MAVTSRVPTVSVQPFKFVQPLRKTWTNYVNSLAGSADEHSR